MSLSLVGKSNTILSGACFPVNSQRAEFWSLSQTQIQEVADALYTVFSGDNFDNDYLKAARNLFNADPQKAIISFRIYPLAFNDAEIITTSSTNFTLMGQNVTVQGYVDKVNTNRIGFLRELGYLDIDYFQGIESFLSYSPYTVLQLYIPFYGLYDLDCKKFMHHRVKVYCTADLFAGDVIYYICRCAYNSDNDEELMDTLRSHVAIDIDMYSNNFKDWAKDFTKDLVTLPATLLAGAFKLMQDTANFRLETNNLQSGSLESYSGFHSPLTMHLLRYNPVVKYNLNDSDYAHLQGVPCDKIQALHMFNGFTKIEEVHMSSIVGATDPEINEIENLLKKGVRV